MSFHRSALDARRDHRHATTDRGADMINEPALLESRSLHDGVLERTDVLDRV
ncbi:hypothetical protein ACIA8I_06890 [Streptomyces rishiriensis]|uniref:hypothetical protein n=1 Tax=Streptomyces rishiriensis TaxID=68264 RepID=UPI0037A53A5D